MKLEIIQTKNKDMTIIFGMCKADDIEDLLGLLKEDKLNLNKFLNL